MSTSTQGKVVERIHGVEVRDPYRWLEDRRLLRTEQWINNQNRLCDLYFSQNEHFGFIKNAVTDALSAEVIDQATKVGHRAFMRKQLAGQEQAAIWMRADGGMEDTLLIDPAAIGSNIAVRILRISFDGALLAYSVRSSGSDAMEVRIADAASGTTLPDRLPVSYLRGFEFDDDSGGFYYSVEPRGGTQNLSIRHHRLGDSSLNDLTLFSVSPAEHRRLVLLHGDKSPAALVTELDGLDAVQDLYIASQSTAQWKLAYGELRGRKWPLLAHGHLYVIDMEDARNGRVIELSKSGESPRIIVPECLSRIQRVWAVKRGFLVSYLIERRPRIELWSTEGKFVGTLGLPVDGSIELLPLCSEKSSSVFALHESYTEAPSLWEIDLSRGGLPEVARRSASTEKTSAEVREHWYTSRDGARIPIVLISPARTPLPCPRPVVLSGYGGFGSADLPRYSRLARVLVDLGVTIARPSIRGGSEFGEEWHQAATRRHKQKAIDDFLTAAEWLVAEGIADQRHLAIMGTSSGGLLVAAAVIQRPDLFRAVVCTGPLTDMVRYERFDHASRWRHEYGTADDTEDFQALLAYSPYHNVKEDVNYPATLFVTGDADDRCNPAHVRKMAAALQGRPAQREPVVVDYSEVWGHVPTLSLTERIEALSRKIAFLCEQLDITVPQGVSDEAACA